MPKDNKLFVKRQASFSFFERNSEKTGRNAADIDPNNIIKIKSGMRKAALYISSSRPAPNCAAKSLSRNIPKTSANNAEAAKIIAANVMVCVSEPIIFVVNLLRKEIISLYYEQVN